MGPWRHVGSAEALTAWLRRLIGVPDLEVQIGGVAPGLLGLRIRGLRLAVPLHAAEPATEILALDELSLRPSWAPLGVHVTARLYGGRADAHVGLLGRHHRVRLRIDGVRLERSPLAATTDLSLDGSLAVAAELAVEGREPATVGGRLGLRVEGLASRGGRIGRRPLPPAELGTFGALLNASRGRLTIETAGSSGPDLDSELAGEVVLTEKLAASAMRLRLRVRPTPAFFAREPDATAALAAATPPDLQGYHAFVIGPSFGAAEVRPAGPDGAAPA